MSDFNSSLIVVNGAPSESTYTGGPGTDKSYPHDDRCAVGRARGSLVYSRDGDDIVIIASMGGAPRHPSWYHNIVANPRVTIEVDGAKFEANARITEGDERRRLYDQHAELHDSFTEYEAKTGGRVIPVIVLRRAAASAAA